MYRSCVGLTAYCECRCEYAKFGSFFQLPPNLSPLTGSSRDVGRRVMVPASLWPDWPCEEFEGRGWLAVIERSLRSRATVRFLVAHDDAGRPFVEHLSTEVLCPV